MADGGQVLQWVSRFLYLKKAREIPKLVGEHITHKPPRFRMNTGAASHNDTAKAEQGPSVFQHFPYTLSDWGFAVYGQTCLIPGDGGFVCIHLRHLDSLEHFYVLLVIFAQPVL